MALEISAGSLLSRQIRKGISGKGPRLISLSSALAASTEKKGNLIQRIVSIGTGLFKSAGWLISIAIKALTVSVTAIFQWIINGVTAIAQFNWNATDAELSQFMKNQNLVIASIWGGVLGQSIGWLSGIAVGYGVSLLVPVIGGASLARAVAGSVGAEAAEELLYGVKGAILTTAKALGTKALLSFYLSFRRSVRVLPRGFLRKVFGEKGGDFIKDQWGEDGGPNLSFANQIEESVESINSDALRVFVESLLDEAWDSFIEAGFIVASELDEAYSQSKQAAIRSGLGQERAVYLQPDKESDEQLVITGREQLVKQQVLTTLGTHRLMYNRDVGQLVGQPIREAFQTKPQRRRLTIEWRGTSAPPWRMPDGKRAKVAECNIPDVVRGLTWEKLKAIVEPFTWGQWFASVDLDNGRQMVIYGSSKKEAIKTLERMLTLTSAKPLDVPTAKELETRHPSRKKAPTLVYPAFATLLVKENSIDDLGTTDKSGKTWDDRRTRTPLWPSTKPADFTTFD